MEKNFIDWLKTEQLNLDKQNKIEFKVKCFEYFVFLLIKNSNSLKELKTTYYGSLKIQSLLFFLVSASIDNETNTYPLLDVFDNFHALPYGIIERDVFEYIKNNNGEFSFFKLDRCGIELKSVPNFQ